MASKKSKAFQVSSPFAALPLSFVELPDAAPTLPLGCVNCGSEAAHTKKEEMRGHALLLPYCDVCFMDVEREGTRVFAGLLSSLMIAVTLLLTLPRLWPSVGLMGYATTVVLGALVPVLVVSCVRPLPRAGQRIRGRAAWWRSTRNAGEGNRVLVCASPSWAEELAQLNDLTVSQGEARRPLSPVMFAGAMLGLAVAPALFSFQHPVVVVLNLGAEPFELVFDGRHVARIEVTSLESPSSGVRLRLPAGKHQVELRAEDGLALSQQQLLLHAGRVHLYAPLSDAHCFWIEEDAYGRMQQERTRYRSLSQVTRFWTLPDDVDNWFSQNPEVPPDERSSGGTLTALRHAHCDEAPPEVR